MRMPQLQQLETLLFGDEQQRTRLSLPLMRPSIKHLNPDIWMAALREKARFSPTTKLSFLSINEFHSFLQNYPGALAHHNAFVLGGRRIDIHHRGRFVTTTADSRHHLRDIAQHLFYPEQIAGSSSSAENLRPHFAFANIDLLRQSAPALIAQGTTHPQMVLELEGEIFNVSHTDRTVTSPTAVADRIATVQRLLFPEG